MADKCAGTTKAGNPCSRNASNGAFCATHANTPVAFNETPTGGIGNPDAHITVNAVINYIIGGLTLLFLVVGGIFLMVGASFFGEWLANYYEPLERWVAGGGAFIGILMLFFGLLFGVPQVLAATGLTQRKEMGRTLALVVAAFHILYGFTLFVGNTLALVNLLFGGYAFWSLLHPTVKSEFTTGNPA